MATPLHKVVFIGSSGVGKTAIITRLQGRPFTPDNLMTIAGGCVAITARAPSGESVDLHVWDTAGQEKYRNVIPIYFKGAGIIVIVYDITDVDSFRSLKEWATISQENGPPDAKLMIIGNKVDLDAARVVQLEDGHRRAQEMGAISFLETSALNGQGISQVLEAFASAVLQQAMPETVGIPVDETLGGVRAGGCC
jgi:small GTP-binding protein